MATEIVYALEAISAPFWTTTVSGGFMDTIDVAAKVFGIFKGWSITAREAALAHIQGDVRSKIC
jgi:hypothetical protein